MSGRGFSGGGTPFERLLKQQCQKGVSAAKSAGVVGKWGSASFTSLRHAGANGAIEKSEISRFSKPREKKFFKSRANPVVEEDEIEPLRTVEAVEPQQRKNTRGPSKVKASEPLSEITPIVPAKRPAPENVTSKFFKSRANPVGIAAEEDDIEPPCTVEAVETQQRKNNRGPSKVKASEPLSEITPIVPAKRPAPENVTSKFFKSRANPVVIAAEEDDIEPPSTVEAVEMQQRKNNRGPSKVKTSEPLSEITPIVPAKRPAPENVASIKPNTAPKRPNKFFTSKAKKVIEVEEEEKKEEDVVKHEPLKVPPLKLRIKTSVINSSKTAEYNTESRVISSSEMKQHSKYKQAQEAEKREVEKPKEEELVKVSELESQIESELELAKDISKQVDESVRRESKNNGSLKRSAVVPEEPDEPVLRVESHVSVNREDLNGVVTVERTATISRTYGKRQKLETTNHEMAKTTSSTTTSTSTKIDFQETTETLLFDDKITTDTGPNKNDFKSNSKTVAKVSIGKDWSDDEDNQEEDEEEDPEISFKDESLVLSPKEARTVGARTNLGLQKASTVASASDLDKEFGLHDNFKKSESNSQESFLAPVVVPKKRSIFKSKNADSNASEDKAKKGLSLYKHKWNAHNEQDEFKEQVFNRAVFGAPKSSGFDFDDDFGPSSSDSDVSFAASKLVRVPTAPSNPRLDETNIEIMSVKCPKEQKDYYTVIKNVKKAHQIQDSGEFQEFNDDVDYILGGLGSKNSLSTRCLSTVTLASKCMEPGFRMHLRAHGTVTKFFGELRDSPQNPSLALCASTVLFVLSQDRLNMDLDRDSLELMLNLLDTDSRIKDALDGSGMNKKELEKNKQKVQDLVAAMKKKGHAVNLSLDQISADHLSMETLLSLTSKRAGEWFKEELRDLGGLEHLVRTMSDCVAYLTADEISVWTEQLHNKLKKADRVLKVLENVTHENEENCLYLLNHEDGKFLDIIHTLYKLLDEEVPLNPNFDASDKESVAFTLRDSLFDCMRVYINLVHDYHSSSFGSELAGKKEDLMDIVLHCLFILPESIPFEKRFDVHVLALTMLINLVENCVQNRDLIMKSHLPDSAANILARLDRQSAPHGLVKLFLEKEENARTEESKTDNILDGVKEEDSEADTNKDEEKKKSQEERIDETVAKLLHKAGRHMEDTLIGSYITLVIGYLIIDKKENEQAIREYLPNQKFTIMVTVLKKFFNFMNLTASATVTSSRGLKATEMIIKHLEKIDKVPEDETTESKLDKLKKEAEMQHENFDDLTIFDMTKDENETTAMEHSSSNSTTATFFDNHFSSEEFGKL